MANLKLIKVTGSPFCSSLYGCIGIQIGDNHFQIIKDKMLNLQSSFSGNGWEYVTAEEIAENWKLIYPHWTPEVGDKVIITQDYEDWTNCRCTILEKDSGDNTYYRVKKESGRMSTFDYTCQMILAPTTSTTSTTTVTETKSESPIGWQWQDLKVGDKVKIIGGDYSSRPVGSIFTIDKMENKDYGGKQPIRLIGSDGEDKGWPYKEHFEPYYGDVEKPKFQSKHGFTLGDRVLCVETGSPRANKTGTVVDFDGGSVGVAYEDYCSGHECNGHCPDGKGWYSRPEFIKHYTEPEGEPEEPEETATSKFKIGDRVKSIGTTVKGYGKLGTVRKIGGSVGVEFDENVDGHTLDGCCKDGHGWWVGSPSLELVTESKPKEETVIIRFLTEQQFKDQSLWIDGHPRGWNSSGLMNKYLGQSLVIPTSSIRSDGSFRYQEWRFVMNDYIVTEEVSSSKSISTPVIATKPDRPSRRFKVGDKVTYKSLAQCGGDYRYGGTDQGGFVGTVESESEYESTRGCYGLRVSTEDGFCFNMLESEFHEYDGLTIDKTLHIHKTTTDSFTIQDVIDGTATPSITPTFFGHVDPLFSYKQKPITIKQKPKSKLTII